MGATKYHFSFRHDVQTALSLIQFETLDVVYVALYATFIGILNFGATISVQFLINSISFTGQVYPVVLLSGVTIIILFFVSALQIMSRFIVEKIQQRVLVRLSFGAVDALGFSGIDKSEWSRSLIAHRFFDVFTYQTAITKILVDGLGIAITTVLGLILVIFYHPLLALLAMIILIAFSLIVVSFFNKAAESNYLQSSQKYRLAEWLAAVAESRNLFWNPRTHDFAVNQTDLETKSYLEQRQEHFNILMWQQGSLYTLQAIAAGVFLGMGGIFVVIGTINLGQLVAAEVILVSVLYGLVAFGKSLESFYDLMTSAQKMLPLLDGNWGRKEKALFVSEHLENPMSLLIQSASLKKEYRINQGEVVALKGADVFSRRDFFWHLSGLETSNDFEVEISGTNLSSVSHDWRKSQILLLDGSTVFDVDLKSNLTLQKSFKSTHETTENANKLPLFMKDVTHEGILGPASEWAREPRMRLHVALLRAFFTDAKIVLIDNLFNDLSRKQKEEFLQYFKESYPEKILIVNSDCDLDLKVFTQVMEWTREE